MLFTSRMANVRFVMKRKRRVFAGPVKGKVAQEEDS